MRKFLTSNWCNPTPNQSFEFLVNLDKSMNESMQSLQVCMAMVQKDFSY